MLIRFIIGSIVFSVLIPYFTKDGDGALFSLIFSVFFCVYLFKGKKKGKRSSRSRSNSFDFVASTRESDDVDRDRNSSSHSDRHDHHQDETKRVSEYGGKKFGSNQDEEDRRKELEDEAYFYRKNGGPSWKVEAADKDLGRTQRESDYEDERYEQRCRECGEPESHCRCCSRCDSYPCECCDECGQPSRYCRCCSRCGKYRCECDRH